MVEKSNPQEIEESLVEHLFLKTKSLLTKNFLNKKICLDEP